MMWTTDSGLVMVLGGTDSGVKLCGDRKSLVNGRYGRDADRVAFAQYVLGGV